MKGEHSLANRFATPPRDVDYEELWGKLGPVPPVKALFPYFVAAVLLTFVFLLLGWPYFTSLTAANIYLLLRIRSALFQKARAAMNSLEYRDYLGIWLYIVPAMLAIWFFLGAFLSAVFSYAQA